MNFKKYLSIVSLCIAACLPAAATAQDTWPSKPVRLVLGVAPGGATDIQARLFAQKLSTELGQSFVVENRPGAGEVVAIQAVARSAPDGYTILAVTPGLTMASAFSEKPPFDALKDLVPVSIVSSAPYLIVVPASSPFKTMNDLLAFGKANPGKLNFGTAGLNSPPHLGAAWIGSASGASPTMVSYKGTGPALTALLAGEIHMILANPISALQHVKAGRLRALAVTGPTRSKVFPDLPTVAESGVTGFDVTTWHGWLVPAGTPPAVVTRIQRVLENMVRSREVADALSAEGAEAIGSTSEQFRQTIIEEQARWKRVVKLANIKTE